MLYLKLHESCRKIDQFCQSFGSRWIKYQVYRVNSKYIREIAFKWSILEIEINTKVGVQKWDLLLLSYKGIEILS